MWLVSQLRHSLVVHPLLKKILHDYNQMQAVY